MKDWKFAPRRNKLKLNYWIDISSLFICTVSPVSFYNPICMRLPELSPSFLRAPRGGPALGEFHLISYPALVSKDLREMNQAYYHWERGDGEKHRCCVWNFDLFSLFITTWLCGHSFSSLSISSATVAVCGQLHSCFLCVVLLLNQSNPM